MHTIKHPLPLAKTIPPGCLALFGVLLLWMGCDGASHPDAPPRVTALSHPGLEKPLDLVLFKGHYVATEMNRGQLTIFDDLSFSNLRHLVPSTIGKKFQAPHFMSLSPWGTLLIGNGWGTSIVEIEDLDGKGWREFGGVDIPFNAPHGICVDDKGWIYVGDSLNSRIVRFRDMTGSDWQVFGDIDRRVAYSRQLAWHQGALWVSNSYEKRPGLNPGKGATVLRIADFGSGEAEVVHREERANITGILPLNGHLYVGRWGPFRSILRVDLKTGAATEVKGHQKDLGVPYGMFRDPKSGAAIAACFGDFKDKNGGLLRIDTPAR